MRENATIKSSGWLPPPGAARRLRAVFAAIGSWLAALAAGPSCAAEELPAAVAYRDQARPILETYCFGCHGYGASEGGRTLDEFDSDQALVANRELWLAVLKNVRAGIMPPAGEEHPDDDERRVLFDWIKFNAFGIDPADPDPGRVTLRRLNRVEYRNTIRDLLGVDFDAADAFPADDSGYGFDNIGDVLSISPLLMEKYLQAAETIVAEAVPAKSSKSKWRRKKKFRELFPREKAPEDPQERDAYAREVIARFARRAYRRPVNEEAIDRLAVLAKETYTAPGQSFESGIGRAMVAVLASPRFLFRVEDVVAETEGERAGSHDSAEPSLLAPRSAPLDEHALASRLSYFLWSTMPDDELMRLADRGELRAQLVGQVERMLKDRRSKALAANFAGQWLRSRDVENYEVDLRFGHDLAEAMRQETESCFDYVVREDRSLLELIDSDYTFLNERLAKHYGVDGVSGGEMRRVELAEDSPRGGVLTQGTLLVVTSNPTRTSPVKRGLFILDNILGTPPPPPPEDVPALEEAAAAIGDHAPTIRELQEQHRRDPLCHSCHARMDPLGLALENFNVLGVWRETDQEQPIDASGTLLTGEEFAGIRELKGILKDRRRLDFYRCLTEKLLTYALGRGLEYYDEHTVDEIVERLEREEGKFSVLVNGIVHSAPFQRQRRSMK